MNGKKYELSVTEHHQILDPDEVRLWPLTGSFGANGKRTGHIQCVPPLPLPQVVTRLSAVMDYSRVPGGALALRCLQEKHRDVHLSYDAALELYTLYGAYSKVQAALTQLFGQSGNQQSDTVQRAASGSWSERLSPNRQVNPSEDLRANPNKQNEESRTADTLRAPAEVLSSSSQRDLTADAYGLKDAGQRGGTTPQLTWPLEEDSLLIVDADMFQYLQKYCQNDYQQILRLYGVEVVEVTNQGFTSLYLQSAAGAGEGVPDRTKLRLATNAISQFFQEKETKIWRAEFLKSIFSSERVLQMAKDNLRLRYPTILLKEDDTNVYMIGDSRDVCDAKRFFLDQSLDQCLKSEENETKDDAVRRCRLAPQFKESGLPPFGSRPTDFCRRGGLSAQSRPKCSGPMLGFNVLSEPAQIGNRVPGASPQISAEDISFTRQSSLPPTASAPSHDPAFNSDLIQSKVSTSLRDRAPRAAVPGSTLKRANSFSGTPQRKAQLTQQRSQDDSNRSTGARTGTGAGAGTRAGAGPGAGALSSGSTDSLSKDRQTGYHEETLVSALLWQHIKEAYSPQVDDLTSDVQTRESTHAGGNSVTLSLRGASPSKLKSCRLGLQKLLDSVNKDFSVHNLPLSELGLTDPEDETLLACCHNVRNCFRTVTVQVTKKNVLLLGPKFLCSEVAASLLSVFWKDVTFSNKQQEFSIPSSKCSPATLSQGTEGQSAEPMPESGTGTTAGSSIDQETRRNQSSFGETTHVNGSASQPRLSKDPVMKEKVQNTGTENRNGQKSSLSGSKIGDSEGENDGKSVAHPEEEPSLSGKERLDSSQKDSGQQRRSEREESRSSAEAEPLQRGIHGRMLASKLNISILGHKNDSAIKITYYIHDGIQQVRSFVGVS